MMCVGLVVSVCRTLSRLVTWVRFFAEAFFDACVYALDVLGLYMNLLGHTYFVTFFHYGFAYIR